MKIRHYLKPPTEYGGANGYIMHFVSDLLDTEVEEYINTKAISSEDVLVFHRADGIKIKIINALNKLRNRSRLRIVQTFHNPVLPYKEAEYNNQQQGKFNKLKEAVRFYLSIILADMIYFASPHSIDSYYESRIFSLLIRMKKVVFFPTLISQEKVSAPGLKKKSDKEVFYGFLGRRANVKGANIFESIAKRYRSDPYKKFIATWSPELNIENIECLGVQDKWSFLSKVDFLIIPNTSCYYDLVFLEALTYDIPVITTALGGAKDIIDDYFLLYPPEEIDEIDLNSIEIDGRHIQAQVVAPSKIIRHKFSIFIERALLK